MYSRRALAKELEQRNWRRVLDLQLNLLVSHYTDTAIQVIYSP
jgi:hypothetical protein